MAIVGLYSKRRLKGTERGIPPVHEVDEQDVGASSNSILPHTKWQTLVSGAQQGITERNKRDRRVADDPNCWLQENPLTSVSEFCAMMREPSSDICWNTTRASTR